MKISRFIMIMVALLIAAFAWAGDLTLDNLTVTKDAAIFGNLYFSSIAGGTNVGGTAAGGTITTYGNYSIHTFTNVGTTNFVVSGGALSCDVLVVAGGGGGSASGGGAGGMISNSINITGGSYTVTVGGGGVGGNVDVGGSSFKGTNGNNSVFNTITATGGGGGGSSVVQQWSGLNGGSGGGANYSGSAGTGISGQGNNGGLASTVSPYPNGGGGGAGAVGGTYTAPSTAGNGGAGLSSSISGAEVGYAGGGGGCPYYEGTAGTASHGGGAGGANGGVAGVKNTGGGGGASGVGYTGGNGGSGIVIVRYQVATSNVVSLSISSNGISQTSASGANVFMGKVGIGTNNPVEKLHVVGNARVDGTNIVSAITLGGETRATWPTVAVGALIASSNLSDVANPAVARANLGLGTAATNDALAFDPAGAAGAFGSTLSAHTDNLNNPHQVTASQAGALTPAGNGSQLTGITAGQVGALSTNGGTVNGGVDINGNLGVQGSLDLQGGLQYIPPQGDLGMGSYTNQ